jgi:CelD/BcsL family acetyltransferase involved in cellulose biosynthesis
LSAFWRTGASNLQWGCPFALPAWLKNWWQHFGHDHRLYTVAIGEPQNPVGVAAFIVQGTTARLAGDPDVCDYLDVAVVPAKRSQFFRALLKQLRHEGITTLELHPLRPDAAVLSGLPDIALEMGGEVACEQVATSAELALPSGWEAYLQRLKGKQRHEIRRKLRRLQEAGRVVLRCVQTPRDFKQAVPLFLRLFRANRPDKADFMNPRMASFFTHMGAALAEIGMLRLYLLDLDDTPTAAVICFDFGQTLYLYNNGYDEAFRSLSVGLLSKVLTIKDGIQLGKRTYDFLKGEEHYKRQLGGQTVPLYRCDIHL